MLTREDNEILTRTNQGTLMGEALRRYWIPTCLVSEIPEPDCPPVRVKLMGEDLVAFRDTEGRIGLVDEFCPHRRTSLWLGRNEECGLRCVYHGWKFDVDGKCVDMMNEPTASKLKDEVSITAYSTIEMGGVVWAYMGPKGRAPELPKFEWTQVPDNFRLVTKNRQECNWLQALEGGIDTAHAPILHRLISEKTNRGGLGAGTDLVRAKPPTLEVDITDYGYRYVGVRDLDEDSSFVRTYHYIMPFHQIRPQQFRFRGGSSENVIAGHIWVPMDDENTMVYHFFYDPEVTNEPLTDEDRRDTGAGNEPEDVDPANNYRPIRNKDNQWLIDRQVQKYETFTGIEGINTQDQAIQESMGPIVDRSGENLANSDMAIVIARRMLLDAASTVADGGDPPGTGDSYYNVRAIDAILPNDVDWRESLDGQMYRH